MKGLQRVTIHFIDKPRQRINADHMYWLIEDSDILSYFIVLYRKNNDCWGQALISQYAKSRFGYEEVK